MRLGPLLATEGVGEPSGRAVEGGEGEGGRVGGGGGGGGEGGPVQQEPSISNRPVPTGLHTQLVVRVPVRRK